MAAFVVDIANPAANELDAEVYAAGLGTGMSGETVFVEAPSILEALEKVLGAKPGADIIAVSKGRPGTFILG